MSLLANELDVRSILQGQMSLAAVNHICVIHEAMNIRKNLKGLLKDCLENVCCTYSKTCVKGPLKNRQNKDLTDKW